MNRASVRNAILYHPGNLDSPGYSSPAGFNMLDFLRLLRQRYRALVAKDPLRQEAILPLLMSLDFASAFLEKLEILERNAPPLPLQVAVLGPTQAGKSSVMNWLTGQPLATVSPLAGFTVHAQGFAMMPEARSLPAMDRYFHGYERVAREALDPARLDTYTLQSAAVAPASIALQDKFLWDTPDFDSVQARHYQTAVYRIAALADVIVLVVSKDKYGDLSVWEFMRLLEPLEQPTLLLLNKTEQDSRATLIRSVEDKWRAFRADPLPTVIALPYQPDPPGLVGLAELHGPVMAAVSGALGRVERPGYRRRASRLLRTHWPHWTGPILTEHRLRQEWAARVDAILRDCLERYQREYLDHPHHYETFQRALAELLTLLEVPGIGGALLTARKWVTWPMRQLSQLGRLGQRPRKGVDGGEAALLHQLAEHALTRLGEGLLLSDSQDPLEQGWWRGLGAQVSQQRAPLLEQFDGATREYFQSFLPEIEKTARGLFDHLQEHPVVLNSLRATRVTTDAAALALALHTGGIGLQDFVIAPAMLSVTTLLTESALGRFMNKSAELLKLRQKEAVRQLLWSALREPLSALPDHLDADRWMDISPETLAMAEGAIG